MDKNKHSKFIANLHLLFFSFYFRHLVLLYFLVSPRSKMKCNTTIVLDVKTSETSGVAYEKISSIAI